MDFPVNENVNEILDLLEELGMSWIAQEIKELIVEGKYLEKGEYDSKTITPEFLNQPNYFPYNEEEQVVILVKALKTYFIDLHEMWDITNSQLKDIFKDDHTLQKTEEISFSIQSTKTKEPMLLFQPELKTNLTNFKKLIDEYLRGDDNEKPSE